MENIISNFLEFIKTDSYIVILSGAIVILLILYITSLIRMNRIKKSYKAFMEKIGNGTNIEEILEKHIDSINKTITKNEELEKLCIGLDNDIKNCIQKVGIYKYNAYKDTGSDLSFAVALLDERNDGIVLNGIYSREMSNIYAKPIKNGSSEYKITEEENEALKRAMKIENN